MNPGIKQWIKGAILGLALLSTLLFPAMGAAMPKGIGILLLDDTGTPIHTRNPDQYFVPASTLKIFTSMAALDHFGSDGRFSTLAGYDPVNKDLYIKGMGDPLFISEVIRDFTARVAAHFKIKTVRHIYLDNGFFDPGIAIPGTGNSLNPYDATTGALCANFNTLAFAWDRERKIFISPEPQTPLLMDIFQAALKNTGLKKGRILLNREQQLLYPGQLMGHFLGEKGIPVTGRVSARSLPGDLGEILRVPSPFTMAQVVEKLLRFSNNFIANQLMLTMGAQRHSTPATLEKGQQVLNAYAGRFQIPGIHIVEGSGLSRSNRITPRQMGRLLLCFAPHAELLRENENEWYKTGTLSDVRSRAGYIKGKDQKKYPFVVFLNGQSKGYSKIMSELIRRVGIHSGKGASKD